MCAQLYVSRSRPQDVQLLSEVTLKNNSLVLLQIPTQVILEAVASWLVRSSPDRAVRVHALAGNTKDPIKLFCVLEQDTLLSQCLSLPGCINEHWSIIIITIITTTTTIIIIIIKIIIIITTLFNEGST